MGSLAASSISPGSWSEERDILYCPFCHGSLADAPSALVCEVCQAMYRIQDDILVIRAQSSANNLVAQEFYDSPLWPKFRFWEKFTWFCNGGERKARNRVLQHLPQQPGLRLLDVAVGDGVYLPWMPADWQITGIDVSWSQLQACRPRAAGRPVRLIQGEAEALPLRDGVFDAVLSIGAFNYFNDPEGSLREMVRVSRPGATVVISDEMPNLTDRMIGHKVGLPGFDRWFVSRMMNLGDPFTDMVERLRGLNVLDVARRVLPDVQYHEVWHGVGYVLVGHVPG